jgi:S-adenosylmethionine synthetase
MSYLFTSESVSEGHPDKVCDRISDEVVDLLLGKFGESRVACETLTTTNRVVLAGEIRCPHPVSTEEIIEVARRAVKSIGYEQDGFHWENMDVANHLHEQSPDIAMGVDSRDNKDGGAKDEGAKDEGAGDQGIMFGYACRETEVLMPAPIYFSHQILKAMARARHAGEADILEPDSKSQITCLYENGKPVKAESVVISTQHKADVSQSDVRDLVRRHVMEVLPDGWMCDEEKFYVNPTGNFVIGGPDGDAGLTGRKIIVDTYGGAAPHGGGAFSGKDPTKVDRSAAYAARYVAKNIVAAGLAEKCTIQLSYAIGVSYPLSIYVDTEGTGVLEDGRLADIIPEVMDLTPRGIRKTLKLNAPIYAATAAYGHFGRDAGEAGVGSFSWESLDLVDTLKKVAG